MDNYSAAALTATTALWALFLYHALFGGNYDAYLAAALAAAGIGNRISFFAKTGK